MKSFIGKNFLLGGETARELYHGCAAKMPIIDYHCHIDPKDIAENKEFSNVTRLMLYGDHYKWRLMRAAGEPECYITGGADDREKFFAYARALPASIGNPVYHWTHMELRRYFGCELPLGPETAAEIWDWCEKKIKRGGFCARGIIDRSNVELIATTDDPCDDLAWHRQISGDQSFRTKVIPSFRPDRALNIEKPGFAEYLEKLGAAADLKIGHIDDLYEALLIRINHFGRHGCVSSDHGLDYVPYASDAVRRAQETFAKAAFGGELSADEIDAYKTSLLLFLGREYARQGWVMQLHYGAHRNVNTLMASTLGPDTGFDSIGTRECQRNIAALLDRLDQNGSLPKTVLYSLNQNDDAALSVIGGCFNEPGVSRKVQHGSAWWHNDTKQGIEAHLTCLASRGALGG
ncbi:MAG: glucuronate isomerase, partial [Defluviitaleaceae bacterium]|nr:glucuronate isomerase [Defluviitaleaceae bacterium]